MENKTQAGIEVILKDGGKECKGILRGVADISVAQWEGEFEPEAGPLDGNSRTFLLLHGAEEISVQVLHSSPIKIGRIVDALPIIEDDPIISD